MRHSMNFKKLGFDLEDRTTTFLKRTNDHAESSERFFFVVRLLFDPKPPPLHLRLRQHGDFEKSWPK